MTFAPGSGRQIYRGTMALTMLALAACAQQPREPSSSLPEGSTYVAMGSSYASGPGIGVSADSPPNRCQRSADNYAHQLARKRNLHLVDVSCGGATTANILGPWRELPPQIDAVTADTRLVTVTIGGNDVGFVSGLMMASCDSDAAQAGSSSTMCKGLRTYAQHNPQAAIIAPDEAAWTKVGAAMEKIVLEVRRRAPQAQLIFVDYIDVLPETGSCASVPLSAEAAARARSIARRLAELTATVAHRMRAGLIQASELTRGHDACAKDNWVTGLVPRDSASASVPYHPNLAAMTAIADALDKYLAE